jgi:cobaltochelatase CobN
MMVSGKKFTGKRPITYAAFAGAALFIILAFLVVFHFVISPTRIALVNFQDFQYAEITELNHNPFIKITRINLEDPRMEQIGKYHVAILFGKGLRLTPDVERSISWAGLHGTKLFVFGSLTQYMDGLTNMTGNDLDYVKHYLGYGGSVNNKRLLTYCRRVLHGKSSFCDNVLPPMPIPEEAYFHGGDEEYFESFNDYQRFYQDRGFFKPDAPRVLVLNSNLSPRSSTTARPVLALIKGLEQKGLNVFPVNGFFRRLEYIKEVKPDIIVYLSHGRMSPGQPDESASLLKETNVPLLCPIVLFEPYDTWQNNQKGMAGGNLSQNVIVPEIDGGTVPFVIGAQFPNQKGLMVFKEIPERIESFCNLVENLTRLQRKANNDKRVAIVYYKGPGRNALTATGLNVTPSLLNLLHTLKAAGYTTGDLPASESALFEKIQKEGPVIGTYAHGATDALLRDGNPELIPVDTLRSWIQTELPTELAGAMEAKYGQLPGEYLSFSDSAGRSFIAVPRLQFGNITLLPQLSPGSGDEAPGFKGVGKYPPPYPYIASYLWIRKGFKADALIHFGTYGNFEFLPFKQPPLSSTDWTDVLLGSTPHLYVYCIESVGDALIAKRRSYATIISHLTPPFKASGVYGELADIKKKLDFFTLASSDILREEYRRSIFELSVKTGILKALHLSADSSTGLSDGQINAIAMHVSEIAGEKIHEGLYTLGSKYSQLQLNNTCKALFVDMLMQRMGQLDLVRKNIGRADFDNMLFVENRYRKKAISMVDAVLENKKHIDDFFSTRDQQDFTRLSQQPSRTPEENNLFSILQAYRITIESILPFRNELDSSSSYEMQAILNGLEGRFTPPSPGGDPLITPSSVPTGKNMYGINVEQTPDEEARLIGEMLADQLCKQRLETTGSYPRKVAVTLWGGEFVRDRGSAIGQIFSLLGVRPLTNTMGTVYDVALIPCNELKRPRIDVVVQTSGQFRDLAASRVALIEKAIRLVAEADEGPSCGNFVREGSIEMERLLKEKGYSPAEARELSFTRIFGGINGNYGSGIREIVQAGDQWNESDEIASRYIENMGAMYSENKWGAFRKGLFEVALMNTEVVTQSVNSHLTTPLSLDNVYEFMGGISSAIKMVSGKEPVQVFGDLRIPSKPRVREAGEMIWAEARSSILNPAFIEPMLKNGSSGPELIAEHFRNAFGWNALSPQLIGSQLWEQLNDVYVKDSYNLHMQETLEKQNPFAFQEMTAVLLEAVRKGFWNPGPAVTRQIAQLHASLVQKHKAGCSYNVCNNSKLRDLIRQNLDKNLDQNYIEQVNNARFSKSSTEKPAIVLKKEETSQTQKFLVENREAIIILGIIIIILVIAVVGGMIRQQRRQ